VLGNHDYTGDALAQQSAAIREVDSRWTSVNKSFIVEAGIAIWCDFLFLLSLYFAEHTHTNK
jgi:tartrate-resistant acid phosphatase type 5